MVDVSIPTWTRRTTAASSTACSSNAFFTPTTEGGTFSGDVGSSHLYRCAETSVDLTCCTHFKITTYHTVVGDSFKLWIYDGSTWNNFANTASTGSNSYTIAIPSGYDKSGITIVVSYYSVDSHVGTFSATKKVSTAAAPTASFTTTSDPMKGNAPFSVTFTDASTAGCPSPTYLWEYGDGETASTSGNKTHVYSAGLYTADLTLSNSEGSDSDTVDVYAWGIPGAVNITGNSMVELSTGYTYSQVITGGYADSYTYAWTVTGSGVTGSDYSIDNAAIASPEITFNTNKVFTVNCTVTAYNDTPTAIGVGVVGSLDVYVGTAPAASRMKEDFCMIVGDKILRIR